MIAYLVNQYPKISHTFIRREIRALEERGLRILRLSIRSSGEKFEDPADRDEERQTRVVMAGGARALGQALLRRMLGDPRAFVRAVALLARVVRREGRPRPAHLAYLAEACLIREWLVRERCTHLHAHFATNPATVALLCRALGGPPYSFTLHGFEELDDAERLSVDVKVAHSAFAIAISDYGRERMRAICGGANDDKLHVLRCGLDQRSLTRPIPELPTAPRVACVARLSEEKGHRVLLAAAALLARAGEAFELVLVGDGPLRGEIEAQVRSEKLEGRVRITGWMSGADVERELDAARVTVLASYGEGLPVVLMESLAAGRPAIATAITAIPELIVPGVTGWLVPPGDARALADALRSALHTDLATLARMGEEGRARVRELHDIEVQAERLAGLFAEFGGGV